MTNRSDRSRMAIVEAALRKRDEAHRAADERALQRINRAGFRFSGMNQVLAYVGRVRKVHQAQADLINEFERLTRES